MNDVDTTLRGNFQPDADRSPLTAPADPAVGENNGFWIFDDAGRFTFFVHLEADSRLWEARREWIELIMADGRVCYGWQRGCLTDAGGPGAASAKGTCIEPFAHWQLSYRGFLHTTRGETMAAEHLPDVAFEQAAVVLEADLRMAAPPWQQGTLNDSARSGIQSDAGQFMGGLRYEQLHRASGTLRIDGETFAFTGTGVRTHRLGRRDLTHFIGHTWHTVLFPSGRAFGYHRFTDPADTSRAHFNEAFVLVGGKRYPAQIVEAPVELDTPRFSGQGYDIRLESELGVVAIRCETCAIGHVTTIGDGAGRRRIAFGADRGDGENHVLNHGLTRNIWDGETGYGLLERSARAKRLR
jgi:hypothetical protein